MFADTSAVTPSTADDPSRVSPARTILVVDDEESVRTLLTRWLEAAGYTVVSARTADDAIRAIEDHAPAVVLCDIRMPGQDGLWLAGQVRQSYPDTAVIMASGVQDVQASLECMRHGVVDYLTKPFGRDRLRDAVRRGIEWHQAASDARTWRQTLEKEMATRKDGLLQTVRAMVIDQDEGIDALLAIALTEREAYAHAHRVRYLAVGVARQLDMDASDVAVLGRAALLHDIGKGALPEAVLRKPATLTAAEQSVVRQFPAIGAEVLAEVPFLLAAAPIVRDAHERVDGQGYPRGVRAATVSLSARILGAADAFDSITHPRVFRDPVTPAEALDEIDRCSGTQFDPAVAAALRSVLARTQS